MKEGIDYYLEKGFLVFTEAYLLKRGYCCGSGCRHCPYNSKNKVKYVLAFTATKELHIGSSRLLLIESAKRQRYFVKMSGTGSPYDLVSEFICLKAARELGLPVTDPHWIWVDENTDFSNVDGEIGDWGRKNYGFNIAFPYFENPNSLTWAEMANSRTILKNLFLFDLFFLIIDRHSDTLHFSTDSGNQLLLDCESSMLLLGGISGNDCSSNTGILKQIKGSPLYLAGLGQGDCQEFLTKIKKINFQAIFDQFPYQLKLKEHRLFLLQKISKTAHDVGRFFELYQSLEGL